MFFDEGTVYELEKRLLELAWKLRTQKVRLNKKTLSYGVFQKNAYKTSTDCIEEIQRDLTALKHDRGARALDYQAAKISEKINVLVRLCYVSSPSTKPEDPQGAFVQGIYTRQQKLQSIQHELAQLEQQHDALLERMNHLNEKDEKLVLSIQSELGHLRRRITLTKEALDQ